MKKILLALTLVAAGCAPAPGTSNTPQDGLHLTPPDGVKVGFR